MCISPISIRGKPTPGNPTGRYHVPCGKCYQCLRANRENWAIRLEEEAKDYLYLSFVTLTYDDEHLFFNSVCDFPDLSEGEIWPTVSKEHLQKFIKRLRIHVERHRDKYNINSFDIPDIRYFAVGEYGEKGHRPHYHIILFGLSEYNCDLYKLLSDTWTYGSHFVGEVNSATIRYTCKYICVPSKPLSYYESHGCNPPFRLMSRKPALGYKYVERNKNYHETEGRYFYPYIGGTKGSLPRYYKDHLYSKSSRSRESANSRRLAEVHGRELLQRLGYERFNRLQRDEWESHKMASTNFVRRLQKG